MLDANALSDGQRLHATVCVVGAGAVGLTLAAELAAPGLRVLVIEAGPLDGAPPRPADPSTPAGTRPQVEHGYGGHRTARPPRLWPISPSERQPRSFLPDAAWRLPDAEFEHWLVAAIPQCRENASDTDAALAARPLIAGLGHDRFDDRGIDRHAGPRTIGARLRPVLAARPEVCVLANARAVAIELSASGDRASGLRLRSRVGRSLEVTADVVVLTSGAVETSRLLLASREQRADTALTAHRDLGRYLMTPLHGVLGSLRLRHEPAALWLPGSGRRHSRRPLQLTPETQHRLALPAMAFRLRGDAAVNRHGDPQARTLRHRYRLGWRCEQRPESGNRLVVTDIVDRDGWLPLRLDWQVADADIAALRQALDLLDRTLRQSGLGQFDHDPGAVLARLAQPPDPARLVGGARMGLDRQHSVVDADGRVHGVERLYVCGPATFPSSGIDDPLLTSMALALRLAAHLRLRLDRPSPAVTSPAAARPFSAAGGA